MLEEKVWMKGYFPSFYSLRLPETAPERRAYMEGASGLGSGVLDSFLHVTLGSYLSVKSWGRSTGGSPKAGWHSSVSETSIGRGHHVFKSNNHRKLRKMYGETGAER